MELVAASATHVAELAAAFAVHDEELRAACAVHAEEFVTASATHAAELATAIATHAKLEEELVVERAIVKECEENTAKEIEEYNTLVERYNKIKGKYFNLKKTKPPPSATLGDCDEADGGDIMSRPTVGGDHVEADGGDLVEADGGDHVEADGVGDDVAPSSSYGSVYPSRPLKKLNVVKPPHFDVYIPNTAFEVPSPEREPNGSVFHSCFGLSD